MKFSKEQFFIFRELEIKKEMTMLEIEEKEKIYLFKEFEEINNYIRKIFSIGITWYSFFITSNLFIAGLILTKILEKKVYNLIYIYPISLLFIFVNILALLACTLLAKYFLKAENRLSVIIDSINNRINKKLMSSPFSSSPVVSIINILKLSLIGMTFFWISLIFFTLY